MPYRDGKLEMLLKRIVSHQEQRSILNDEQAQVLTVFEVSMGEISGFVRKEDDVDKRDVETKLFASSEELATAIREQDAGWELDGFQYSSKPDPKPGDETIDCHYHVY